ncbi:glycosyltransferase [Bacteroides finegoldii]|uniref:glycosyltransferase n=1 Tax=Bacteroides finegoldii TaxID=338188 RepID=UPI0018977B6F|nr:glycosyltransferase [Bacteroides finegoldii]
MNILFIYDAPLRPENGGTERATKLVMDELDRRGHHTIGILHWNQTDPAKVFLNGQPVDSISAFLRENHINVVVNQIAFHPRFLSQFLQNGGQEWKDNGGKIISFMHLDPTPVPRAELKKYFSDWNSKNLMGKLKRLAFIMYLPIFNHKNDKAYRKGLRYLYDKSDSYVLMSESFLDIFTSLSGLERAEKVSFIPNMLTFSKIATERILESKDNIVLVVARMDDEQKNISFIIKTWQSLKNHYGFHLHILGDGQDADILRDMAACSTDIHFEGSQPPLSWYQKAKVFLMASPREGWGLTITESLQNGVVPIVLNTSKVFKDIISDASNGFLPNTEKEYTERLESLLSDNSKCRRIAIEGLKSAHRFTPEIVGEKWQSLLNKLQNK